MADANGRKTGGRKKGAPNKRKASRELVMAKARITPLEYMLGVLKDDTADPQDRRWAANAAAPYCHAKLAAVAVELDVSSDLAALIAERRKDTNEAEEHRALLDLYRDALGQLAETPLGQAALGKV